MGVRFWSVAVAAACTACGGRVGQLGDAGAEQTAPGAAGTQGERATAGAPTEAGSPSAAPPHVAPLMPPGAGGQGSGTSMPTAGVPLVAVDGWVDGMSNVLGIQGAMFAFADVATRSSLVEDHSTPGQLCIKGTAAPVDLSCTPAPPARDCFEQAFGALIALNLNQQLDLSTGQGDAPRPYDASGIEAFAFTLSGQAIPAPLSLRFGVESTEESFCSPPAKPLKPGENEFAFEDLRVECWKSPGGPSATTSESEVVRLTWQVVTNSRSAVPFDFCVSNLRAIPRRR